MILKCAGSSSSGNCFLLINDENEMLLLDAGIKKNDILKLINFNVKDVVGCVCTHSHTDHFLSVDSLKTYGIKVFCPFLEYKKQIKFGGFTIFPFENIHDVSCYGFLVCYKKEKLIYCTDTEYIKYDFSKIKINHMLIEANYDDEFLNHDIPNLDHKLRGHMSLNTAIRFIEKSKTDCLKNVILCHLGDYSSDEQVFIDKVKKIANCKVCAAYNGMEMKLEG
jgi:phosphoribosyl 1,2-cyclic phosphodiesterase